MAKQKGRKQIGAILKEMELVSEGDIQEALQVQREQGGVLGQILVQLGYVTQEDVLFALAAQSGMEVVDLSDLEIKRDILSKVPTNVAQSYKIIPIQMDGKVLKVAISDPSNIMIFDDLKFTLGCEVQGVVATEDQINAALQKYYGEESAAAISEKMVEDAGDEEDMVKAVKEKADLTNAAADVNAPAVVKLLNMLLMNAIRDKASDIHLEPYENDFRIRYRIDGVLYEIAPPPKSLAPILISRIKVMSNLDIAETRLPQDGRIELMLANRPIDLRVSTLPTMFGESCVMRVLDRSVVSLDIGNIGLREKEQEVITNLVDKPDGIMLVTGPTGSGKTTTLYSCLNYANDVGIKLITTEDPVEYDLDGIVQVQIAEDIGLTYASCLRAILRQDPDTILVGEIRDKETAGIAVEASLTGHLVMSTLHTNDAPAAVTRLVDIGVENFLIAAVLQGIVAQRLVRRVCNNCRDSYDPPQEQIMALGLKPSDVAGRKFAFGKGCDNCNNSGHKGRMAIFELLLASDRIRQLIMDNASTAAIRDQARREGLRTLRESGILGIFDGKTTVEEVLRETLMVE